MIFAAVNLISGVKIATAMPALLLLLFNITGIFTIAILLGRVFESNKIVAMSFFVAGSLVRDQSAARPVCERRSGRKYHRRYAHSGRTVFFLSRPHRKRIKFSPDCSFFLLPASVYASFERVCAYFFNCCDCDFVFDSQFQKRFQNYRRVDKIFLKPFPLALIFVFALYFLLIFTPSYFNPAAVGQATGEPTKITRVGFGIAQIESGVGSALLVLGATGVSSVTACSQAQRAEVCVRTRLVFDFVHHDLEAGVALCQYSERPGEQLSVLAACVFLSSYALVRYFEIFTSATSRFFSTVFLFTLLFFVITSGLSDSADAFKTKNQFQSIMETFHSAAISRLDRRHEQRYYFERPCEYRRRFVVQIVFYERLQISPLARRAHALCRSDQTARNLHAGYDLESGKSCRAKPVLPTRV